MAKKLASIEAVLLYGHFSLNHKFIDGVNVVYGNNGGGKTTLLNILANALLCHFNQFAYLEFSVINIEFDDGKVLSISKVSIQDYEFDEIITVSLDDENLISIPVSQVRNNIGSLKKSFRELIDYELPSIAFFPANRSLYDYLDIPNEENRSFIFSFAPLVNYPNLMEIEERLWLESTAGRISPEIKLFVDSVNKFFENKKLVINLGSKIAPFEIVYDDNKTSRGLSSLSSGEKQITTILYAVSLVEPGSMILIDEPEISLHIGWQRKILRIITSVFKTEQIIACTHSPVIGADFELKELEFRFVGS